MPIDRIRMVRRQDRSGLSEPRGETIRWSILIASLASRHALLCRLLACLTPQLTPWQEVVIDTDSGERTIGGKRNALLEAARGHYVCFVDDDDVVAPDYVAAIAAALCDEPDVATFLAKRYLDGRRVGSIHYSCETDTYRVAVGPLGDKIFTKPPNHLCPVRRHLAMRVGFPNVNRGEDTDYAYRLKPAIHSATHLNKELYYYYEVRAADLAYGDQTAASEVDRSGLTHLGDKLFDAIDG